VILVYIYIYIYIESNNIVRLGFKLRSTSAIATICNIVVVVASTTTSHHYCRVILNHVYGRNRNYVWQFHPCLFKSSHRKYKFKNSKFQSNLNLKKDIVFYGLSLSSIYFKQLSICIYIINRDSIMIDK